MKLGYLCLKRHTLKLMETMLLSQVAGLGMVTSHASCRITLTSTSEGVEDLTGGVTTELLTSDILDTDEFWENEILKVNKEFLFGCSTGLVGAGYGNRDGISEGHAYVIMEARKLSTGQRLLKLR
jgi:hypothetical protein